MISLVFAPVTRDLKTQSELQYEQEKDFEEIKEKYKESYLFKSGIDYGIVYFVLTDPGVLQIRMDVKSEHVYSDLVEILKEEYPNAVFIKMVHSL